MAPRPPPSRDERRRAEAGKWEVVDDFVDYFLWKRIHDELVTAGDWTEASDWAKPARASRKMVLLFVESARAMIYRWAHLFRLTFVSCIGGQNSLDILNSWMFVDDWT